MGVLATARLRGQHLADASTATIAAAYPNTAYIGFPLCTALYGAASLTAATIATIFIVCVLFAVAIVLIEISLESERRPHVIAARMAVKLLRNLLIVAPLAGVLVATAHVAVPESVEQFLHLAGAAASPCALICLGVFLGERRAKAAEQTTAPAGALGLTLARLLVQPALTWWLAASVFGLDRPLVHMAVLLAALPTGTGPFMLAEFYGRAPVVASRTILLSTMCSIATLSVLLARFA